MSESEKEDKESSCHKIKCVKGEIFGICVGLDTKSSPKSINVCFMEKKGESYDPTNSLNIDFKSAHELSWALLKAEIMMDTLDAMEKGFEVGFEKALEKQIKKIKVDPEGEGMV